jgi:hypothetical protein
VLAAAGCGGGGSSGYSLDKTKSCLETQGYTATSIANKYLPGSGGNLRVQLTSDKAKALAPNAPRGLAQPDEFVFLVFGKSPAEAQKTETHAVNLAISSLRAKGLILDRPAALQAVQVEKNVFIYSASGPLTQPERNAVTACLK